MIPIGLYLLLLGSCFAVIAYFYKRRYDYRLRCRDKSAQLLAEVNNCISEGCTGSSKVSQESYAAFRLELNRKDGNEIDKKWDEYVKYHYKFHMRYINCLTDLKTIIHKITKT